MDNYPPGFNNILPGEEPIPEDHPRCEGCAEALSDDEQCHEGPDDLCNNCGTVCHGCNEQVWNEHLANQVHPKTLERFLCKWCHDAWMD
jgi:hypothetical protein